MAKTSAAPGDSDADRPGDPLRAIPSVERILSAPELTPLIERYGRSSVKEQVVEWLEGLRRDRRPYDTRECLEQVTISLQTRFRAPLRRVINATGIIIHTNLGRSPIDGRIWSSAGGIAEGYSNLEFDLDRGERGARDEHLSALAFNLFGCEAAILANNNAAGTLLLLAAMAAKREVLVSRGELVEIGGAFRVPDVIQQGGARLREVGTTNRTRANDYAEAVTKKTAAILRVSRSNFDIVGFTETASIEELVEVSRKKKVPLLYDEGSGRVVDLSPYGFSRHQTIRELFASGVDAITCSTDKLIGATQGGLVLGRREIIDRCRRHPLMRALRVGKESYAIVGETLRVFAAQKHEEKIPIYRMLATTVGELRKRAERLASGTSARVVESQAALGGGTTPTESIPSIALELAGEAEATHRALLRHDPPIVGRIQSDRLMLDLRTILETELDAVRAALL